MDKSLFPGLRQDTKAWRYFRHPPTLYTERLALRPLQMADAQSIYEWSSDPEVARYVLWEPHQSIWESREYIRYIRGLYRRHLPSSWGIEVRDTGVRSVMGTIGIMGWNPEYRTCEIGYSLSRACWGRGIMTEAASQMIQFLFEDLDVYRIEAQHDVRNPASGRVMEKCGMQKEGVLRGRVFNKGEHIDVAMWAIVRPDWHAPQSGADRRTLTLPH